MRSWNDPIAFRCALSQAKFLHHCLFNSDFFVTCARVTMRRQLGFKGPQAATSHQHSLCAHIWDFHYNSEQTSSSPRIHRVRYLVRPRLSLHTFTCFNSDRLLFFFYGIHLCVPRSDLHSLSGAPFVLPCRMSSRHCEEAISQRGRSVHKVGVRSSERTSPDPRPQPSFTWGR